MLRSVFTSSSFLFAACVIVVSGTNGFGQIAKRGVKSTAFQCTRRMDVADWKIMLKDIKSVNPYAATRMETEADFRRSQEDNIRQLFAFACQAVKDGVLKDPMYVTELEHIRAETTAIKFDKLVDKQEATPAFTSISDDRITAFYKIASNNSMFENFFKVKTDIMKRGNPDAANRVITPEEREEARKIFARISMRDAESRSKAQKLQADFWVRNGLRVKLQQAQFLSRMYAERLADQTRVTDGEINAYMASHPEFDSSKQRSRAQEILTKAIAGEDFAALANEFTEDPGNVGPQGKSGGLYQDVPRGRMIAEFERAALALEPGKVAPQLVETVYGFHVIKLERKGGTPETYDVRHILIATTIKDQTNPGGRDIPVKEFVRSKLEAEKDRTILARIVAENKIYIAPIPFGNAVTNKPPIKRRQARRKP